MRGSTPGPIYLLTHGRTSPTFTPHHLQSGLSSGLELGWDWSLQGQSWGLAVADTAAIFKDQTNGRQEELLCLSHQGTCQNSVGISC